MKYLKNQRGFGLVGLMVAAAVIPPAVLISMRATDVVSKGARFFKSGQTRQSLSVVRDFLVMNAQNVDGDGSFELLKEEAGGGIPLALPVNNADPYGTPYRYCTWDLDGQNIVNVGYSQNHTAPPAAGVIGRVISAGADKTFQTTCDAAVAAGDDVMVDIHESSVRFSNAGIGGWADNGASVSLLNPSDYVGIGLNNPTHRLELAGGTSVAEGLAMGDVEIFRSGVDTLSLASGDSLNLVSGTLQVAGTTVVDSSRNVLAMNGTFSGGMLDLQNGTSNVINFRGAGVAPPSAVGTSSGTKIILYNNGAGTGPHYSMGVDSNAIWSAVPGTGQYFRWYGGTSLGMQLTGDGNLTVYGSTVLGDAAADALTMRGLATLADSSVTYPLRFGADVDLYRGAANRLDIASGDSLNLAGGALQIAGVTVLDASRNFLNVAGVGTSLIPAVTGTYDLGSAALQYRNLYSQNIYQGGNRVIDAASLAGSVNYLPKFTGANSIGNSILQESGSSILQYTGATRGVFAVISDGDAQAYNEISQRVQTTGGLAAGKPLSWTWSLRKDGYFDGDNSGPGYSLYATRQGGGFYAPILFQADGDIILAGAQNAINGNVGIGTRAPGAQLHVLGTGADSSLTTHGEFVIGSITSANLSMDNNEIMARNNGAASSLALNADGGDVLVGANQTGKALLKVGSSSAGATSEVRINGPNGGNQRDLSFTTGDVERWTIRADSANESGANTGSDLQIIPRTDAGAPLPTAFYVRRANGNVGIAGTPSSDASIKLAVSGDMQVSSRVYFAAALGGADSKAAILGLNAGAGKRFHFFNYANSRDLMMLDGDTGTITIPSLTASSVVFTDASKGLTSTGTIGVGQGGTGISATPTNGQLLIGNGTGYTLAGLTGTANQINVTNGAGSITLSLPQNIHTGAAPTFAGLTVAGMPVISAANSALEFRDSTPVGADMSKARIYYYDNGFLFRALNDDMTTRQDLMAISQTGVLTVYPGGVAKTVMYSDLSNISGTVPVANGGTGLTNYAVGDILYASGATTLSRLAAAAAGNVLLSNGAGVAPSWGKVGLTTHVSGVLPVANGGTGISSTPTNGQLLIGNGTGYTLAGLTGTANQINVTNNAGSITLSLPQDISSTSSPTFASLTVTGSFVGSEYRTTAANGRGIRFWDNDNYKIWMSSTADGVWGGRLDTTSDYNMYFRMTGGTNRGFVFVSGTTPVAQITAAGDLLSKGSLVFKGATSTIIGVGSTSNYGAMNILGAKGGYGGVNFRDASGLTNYGTLMMSDTRSGFYNAADNGWRWYVTDAGLMYGPGGSHVKLGTGVQFPDGTVMTTSSDGTYAP